MHVVSRVVSFWNYGGWRIRHTSYTSSTVPYTVAGTRRDASYLSKRITERGQLVDVEQLRQLGVVNG